MEYQVKEIPGYDGKYTIDTNGIVTSKYYTIWSHGNNIKITKDKIISTHICKVSGSVKVNLRNDITKKNKGLTLVRIMIQVFKPELLTQVGRIQYLDGNPKNLTINNIDRFSIEDISAQQKRAKERLRKDPIRAEIIRQSKNKAKRLAIKNNYDYVINDAIVKSLNIPTSLITNELRDAYRQLRHLKKESKTTMSIFHKELPIDSSAYSYYSSVKIKPI